MGTGCCSSRPAQRPSRGARAAAGGTPAHSQPQHAPAPRSFSGSLLRASWVHSCEQGALVGVGEGGQRLGDRLSHVGCWPAWGTLPWGLWGRRGAGGTFYLLVQGGAGDDVFVWPLWPPTPPPPSLQVFPWLTVPPGSCPWFLMIVTLFLRALNRETPGSDSQPIGFLHAQPLPLKPCPPILP